MRTRICIFILASLCACSNLRPKESCTDSAGWNYQPNNDEEQDYKNLSDRCEVQHGITINREKYLKFRQEKVAETLKDGCTCENGFTGQSTTCDKKNGLRNVRKLQWTKSISVELS
jgi:hypothetical protein